MILFYALYILILNWLLFTEEVIIVDVETTNEHNGNDVQLVTQSNDGGPKPKCGKEIIMNE